MWKQSDVEQAYMKGQLGVRMKCSQTFSTICTACVWTMPVNLLPLCPSLSPQKINYYNLRLYQESKTLILQKADIWYSVRWTLNNQCLFLIPVSSKTQSKGTDAQGRSSKIQNLGWWQRRVTRQDALHTGLGLCRWEFPRAVLFI